MPSQSLAVITLILFAVSTSAVPAQTPTHTPPPMNAIVDVTKFGAKPDDVEDDFETVKKAIEACKSIPHPVLLFPKGTYHFAKEKIVGAPRFLYFDGIEGLTIDGQGSTFIFSGNNTAFYFTRCKGLTLKNVTVDWDKMPFSQGKVIAGDASGIEVEIDPVYPITEQDKIAAMMDYDPVTKLPLGNLDIFGSAIVKKEMMGPQKLKFTFKKSGDPKKNEHLARYFAASVGKLILLRHEIYGRYAVDIMFCENTTLEDVHIYACPGMGIHAAESTDITSCRVEVRIKPGSGRLMSTTADCQYYTFCKGTITVEDGYYEGMGDDGLNITAKYRQVKNRVADDKLEVIFPARVGWQGPTPVVGEKIFFQGAADLGDHGSGVVKAAAWNAAAKMFTVEFTAPLPATVIANDLIYSDAYLPKARIHNSTFRGMRARGVLLSTHDAVVEGCKFEGMVYPGILLKGGIRHGFEGPSPRDVIIRNNTFDGCGGAAIYAYADGVTRPAGALRNITAEGNVIRENAPLAAQRFKSIHPELVHWSAGFCFFSVDHLQIANNRFENISPALFLQNDRAVTISGNTAQPAAPIMVVAAKVQDLKAEKNTGMEVVEPGTTIKPDLNYLNDFR